MARLLAGVRSPVITMLLRTIYACGLQSGGSVGLLEPRHIDSRQMVLRVVGKGQKERVLPLSPLLLLSELRVYWAGRSGRHVGCFPARARSGSYVLLVGAACLPEDLARSRGCRASRRTCCVTAMRRGSWKRADDIERTIQALLGHFRIGTTAIYTHVTPAALSRVVSPLETLPALTSPPSSPPPPKSS